MGILTRFKDIISANINELLDKAEDPAKMVDQYLLDLRENLAEVKKETAGVIAEEKRANKMVDENAQQVAKYTNLAKQALIKGNEGDARVFLAKKQELEAAGAGLQKAYAVAHENAAKMRQMHDKLTADISALNIRKETIKAKVSVAKTQEILNKVGPATDASQNAMDAFDRMESKADKMMFEADAMAELNTPAIDEAAALEEKYKDTDTEIAVDAEIAALKAELGL